ncbi:MAG: methyltransferase domain-containing protein [Crocinitomicaceae bacterium]|nr:methyltransferase domain-containing protein [Crocinitomicaceae bacterium]MDG1776891.1 methyltransferase domain-containing protein [Crocinitomicaceae bacterium]
MSTQNDPMGQAILDFEKNGIDQDIIVSSDLCEDDVISSAYLFRSFEDMPQIEQTALSRSSGKILDIGAGAGIHASHLKDQGMDVSCIDISPRSISYLKKNGLDARVANFFDLKDEKYDTLLMLMNGIGISGTLSNLENTLLQAKSLLNKGGKILCDSSDIKYLYTDDDGGMWVDLNTIYYGNFKFQMKYNGHETAWFDWLYADFDKLKEAAVKTGFSAQKIMDKNDQYLAELIKL